MSKLNKIILAANCHPVLIHTLVAEGYEIGIVGLENNEPWLEGVEIEHLDIKADLLEDEPSSKSKHTHPHWHKGRW